MIRDFDQFSRNLTAKIMAYATGRTMVISDRPGIDAIVQDMKSEGAGLRDLVKHVVTSKAFLSK